MDYIVKFNLSAIKVLKNGKIKGVDCFGECDITTDFTLEELGNKHDTLKVIAYESSKDNPKVKKMGNIINTTIIDILIK